MALANRSRMVPGTGQDIDKCVGIVRQNAAIIANVAALLYLTDKASDLKAAADQVSNLLASGKAMDTLNAIIEVSHG